MNKIYKIFLNTIPVLLMIGLIPFIKNDYLLTLLYIFIAMISLYIIKANKNDIVVLFAGFFFMIISEYIFISTEVETFIRNSLFGLMPFWLPFLWAYGFVAISRSVKILENR